MERERFDLSLKYLLSPPPMMYWRGFSGWIRNGCIHSHKVGKYVIVNLALLTQRVLEKEWTA